MPFVSLILCYLSQATTLIPLCLSRTFSGRPIPNRLRDLMIIPADVKSVQCFYRITGLKASCSKEQQNTDANKRKKKCLLPQTTVFGNCLSWLKPLCFWHNVYFMVQSSNPDVAMNKDYVEYEEQITKMAVKALQIPNEYAPGWEKILADTSLGREGIV